MSSGKVSLPEFAMVPAPLNNTVREVDEKIFYQAALL